MSPPRHLSGLVKAYWRYTKVAFAVALIAFEPIFPFYLNAMSQMAPAFEVSTVKPADDRVSHPLGIGMYTYPGGRVLLSQETVLDMLCQIYGLERDQVSGGPGWVESLRWDIETKPPEASTAARFAPRSFKSRPNEEMLAMLKTLLADRFQLKIHTEAKDGPAYALTVAPKGHKLSVTAHPDDFGAAQYGQSGKPDRPWFLGGYNASMPMFAKRLSGLLRRPVVDRTGLGGYYDFRFEYAAENDGPAATGPSIFTAIEEQVGLRLVSARAPNETLVIDSIQKPSEN
jgi:uncharacterized protein (TIGR03435 family)